MDLAKLLSPAQAEAAACIDAPVCILAGAGSGKTRVVTHRIAYLIEEKRAAPWSILAVTFTNKAAGEMRSRIDQLCPGAGPAVQVGTFHGIAARLLRRYGDPVGVPSSFVIYDQDDAERLLKRVVVDELNLTRDLVKPIAHIIDGWQSEGLAPGEVPSAAWNPLEEKALKAYGLYLERLAGMKAVDFGGLLVKLRDLLRTPAGEEVRRRVKHLLVDEYQDTNRVQAEIVLNLARSAETVAVVGDDDQAIYGWRGASADNLKRFLDALEGTRLVRLEENYRSTKTILEAANGIIAFNEARLGKTLRATGDEGSPIRLLKSVNDVDEARQVVEHVQGLIRHGYSLDEIAVLYRTNALSRPFEDELRRSSLPYRIVGGMRFYDRKEVKDVLATLRAALNPASDVDVLRMIGAVPRGIGDTSLEKVQAVAQTHGVPLLSALGDGALLDEAGLSARVKNKALKLAAEMAELGEKVLGEPPALAKDAVALAIQQSGVADRLEAEGTPDAESRLENLHQLLSAAAQYDADVALTGERGTALGFLEAASLLGGDENERDDGAEKLTLMTLHAAKGLEFRAVFLVGMEEHGFPHSRAIVEDAPASELEEERRLAYVGITRARERLYLTWAQRRMVQGTVRPRQPSRFLGELPDEVLGGDPLPRRSRDLLGFSPGFLEARVDPRDDDDGPFIEYDRDQPSGGLRRRRPLGLLNDPTLGEGARGEGVPAPRPVPVERGIERIRARLQAGRRSPAPAASVPDEPRVELDEGAVARAEGAKAGIEEGARVRHASFGLGTVVSLRGAGRTLAALVRFDDGRAPRVIIARYLEPADDEEPDDVRVVLDPAFE